MLFYGWLWLVFIFGLGLVLFAGSLLFLPNTDSELGVKLRFALAVILGALPFLVDLKYETTVYFVEEGDEYRVRSLLGGRDHILANGKVVPLIPVNSRRPDAVLVNDSERQLALVPVTYTSITMPGGGGAPAPDVIQAMSVTPLSHRIDHFFDDKPPEHKISDDDTETLYWLTDPAR